MDAPFKIFSGTNSRYVAEKIAKSMGITHFADGEFSVSFEESIRGMEIYLVQSTFPSSDNLMELLLMIDAAKRASAKSICAVMPYFGWARQDRKDKPRVAIGAKLIADLLRVAGVDRIMTMDLHADQIQGFFDCPVDHLYASTIFAPYIASLKLDELVIAAPDVGGSKRADSYAKYFDVPMVLCHKSRLKANEIASMRIIGDVKGKNVVLSDPASERVQNSALEEIVFTDSIPYANKCSKVKVLSVSDMFADTIRRNLEHESISSQYLF